MIVLTTQDNWPVRPCVHACARTLSVMCTYMCVALKTRRSVACKRLQASAHPPPRAQSQGHLLAAIDSRSKTQIPVVDNAWVLTFIFFFVSIIVCAMVVINMVVGVFVDCYNNQQQAVGRTDPPPLKSMMKAPVREPSGGIRVCTSLVSLFSLSSLPFPSATYHARQRGEDTWAQGAGCGARGLMIWARVCRHTCTVSSRSKTST